MQVGLIKQSTCLFKCLLLYYPSQSNYLQNIFISICNFNQDTPRFIKAGIENDLGLSTRTLCAVHSSSSGHVMIMSYSHSVSIYFILFNIIYNGIQIIIKLL